MGAYWGEGSLLPFAPSSVPVPAPVPAPGSAPNSGELLSLRNRLGAAAVSATDIAGHRLHSAARAECRLVMAVP